MKSEGLTKIDTINNYFFRVPQEYLFNTRIRGLPPGIRHSVNCTSGTEQFLGIHLSSSFDLEFRLMIQIKFYDRRRLPGGLCNFYTDKCRCDVTYLRFLSAALCLTSDN